MPKQPLQNCWICSWCIVGIVEPRTTGVTDVRRQGLGSHSAEGANFPPAFPAVKCRDGRKSDPTIRNRSDFHYPAKSACGGIACFTPDRIGANYCVNISQTICRCSLSIVWLMLRRQSAQSALLEPADQCAMLSFDLGTGVGIVRVYTIDDLQE